MEAIKRTNISVFCGILATGRALSVCGLLLRALGGLTWVKIEQPFTKKPFCVAQQWGEMHELQLLMT